MKHPILLGIHCHQPVNNFHHVIDEAVENCYRPFTETAAKHKNFKFAVHYSGWLLKYIREKHADLFKLMQEMAGRNQIEFFTGGYFEPVLSSIPSADRVGQINMLSDFIEENFNQRPKGLWLTERVWDPSIIKDAAECGVEYVIVDDYHFISAGYYKDMLYGSFITEQDGVPMKIFPIDKELRYLTPFKPAEKVTEYIRSVKDKGGKMSVIFDDGEKFGVWPDTFEWVYEEKWLEKFIKSVIGDKECEFAHYSDVSEKIASAGPAYLPVTSYFEMGEWSLFASRIPEMENLEAKLKKDGMESEAEVFVKGGIWKNFFSKYPESNRIHKRSLRLSNFLKTYPDDEHLRNAVYAAECNDVLWHGIFGGLYLPNLRNNSWNFIIEAEKRFEALQKTEFPQFETADYDFDDYEEVYFRGRNFNAMFTSKDGGQMESLEVKDNNFNFINTLSRRKEGYHQKFFRDKADKTDDTGISTIHDADLEVSDEVKELIVEDWYNRNSFIDHFTPKFEAKEFLKCNFAEIGDFANMPAQLKTAKNSLTSTRKGGLYSGGEKTDTEVRKKYSFKDDRIDFKINIKTDSPHPVTYVLELNFHFMDMANLKINAAGIDGVIRLENEAEFTDPAQERRLKVQCAGYEISAFKVRTVSQSEKGVDLTDQGVCVLIPAEVDGTKEITGTIII